MKREQDKPAWNKYGTKKRTLYKGLFQIFFISALLSRISYSSTKKRTFNFDTQTVIRAYYLNDQRIECSGVEASFEAEGAIFPQIKMESRDLSFAVKGEILLNQPSGENILKYENRQCFFLNYRVNTLDISQLYLEISKKNFSFYFGKKEISFGRFYEKPFSNARFEAPSIRPEAVLWRETGLFLNTKKEFSFSISPSPTERRIETPTQVKP